MEATTATITTEYMGECKESTDSSRQYSTKMKARLEADAE